MTMVKFVIKDDANIKGVINWQIEEKNTVKILLKKKNTYEWMESNFPFISIDAAGAFVLSHDVKTNQILPQPER